MSYERIVRANWPEQRTFNAIAQQYLNDNGFNVGAVDGLVGRKTKLGLSRWMTATKQNWSVEGGIIAIVQTVFKKAGCEVPKIDGWIGPQTKWNYEAWEKTVVGDPVDFWRDKTELPKDGRTKEIIRYYGQPGTNQTRIQLPYPMIIAWNTKQKVTSMKCHEKTADWFLEGFRKVESAYGRDRIHELGLDLYGGCLNVRKKRGGSSWSSHAWGCAMDIDPANNQLRWKSNRAKLAKPEYDEWWKIWESVGGVSLGRVLNYDWMHVQFMRIY